jgi:glycosyltransferase involved in cell wall biosynthesis
VIYYVTDAFAFPGYTDEPEYVIRLDRRMCRRADMVFPNSRRIADYLISQAHCPEDKLLILPNATRAANLLPAPLLEPSEAPSDIADLPRPIAGVIGNLAANMDWEFLHQGIERTPWLSWVFVGPTDMPVSDSKQGRCRAHLMKRGGRVRFTGYKAYGQLRHYARAVDVAVLPYRKREPTFSGSSTRFYEHMAACRPILSTMGFEELLHKEPLLELVDSAEDLAQALNHLKATGFRDGREQLRWETSHAETWEARAQAMCHASLRKVNQHDVTCR